MRFAIGDRAKGYALARAYRSTRAPRRFLDFDFAPPKRRTAASSADVTVAPRRENACQQLFETVHVHGFYEVVVKS